MTISDSLSRWSYPGDGSQKNFAYTNKIFANSNLKIYVDSSLQSNTLYSVTGVGAEAGGNVTFGTAPSGGSVVLIVRDVPDTQATDIPLAGTFPSRSIEDALDKLTILHQQNSDLVNRALAPGSSDPDAFGAMPLLATFFGKYLAFDTSGNPTPGVSLTSQVVTYAADTFSGNGALTAFALSASPASAAATAVFLSGVRQVPGTDYTVAGATLTFTTAPATGTGNILAVHTQSFAGVPSDGSVTAAKIATGAVVEAGIGTDAVDWLTKIKVATGGDLPYFDAAGDPALLAGGTASQQIRMNSGAIVPEWFTPPFSKSFTSSEQTITSAGVLTIAHGLSAQPTLIMAHLVCKTADVGYSVNDEVFVNPHETAVAAGSTSNGISVVPDATNLNIRFGSATAAFQIFNKGTGVGASITNANWKLVMRAWA